MSLVGCHNKDVRYSDVLARSTQEPQDYNIYLLFYSVIFLCFGNCIIGNVCEVLQFWDRLLIYLFCCAPYYHLAGKSRATPYNPKSNFSTVTAETIRSLPLKLPPHPPNSTSWSDQGFAITSLTNFQSAGAAKYKFAWSKQ